MSDSSLGYTDGAGKNIHTDQRTYSGTAKEDQYFLFAQPTAVTYTAVATGIATTTSASHLMIVQADGTNYTRIKGIWVGQRALAGAVATAQLQVLRTTTAGTGGSSISAYPLDGGDTSPYAGVVMTLPSSKGTEGVALVYGNLGLAAANPVTTANEFVWPKWNRLGSKPIVLAPATGNGICIKIVTGIATSTVDIMVDFEVTAFL